MAFSNIVHNEEAYTSSVSSAYNAAGILFVAAVINPPGGIDTQYCVIHRIDTTTKENKEIKRLYAKDSRALIIAEGADPLSTNGKYGNVTISINPLTNDIGIVLEMRYDNINKQRWGVLRGLAV